MEEKQEAVKFTAKEVLEALSMRAQLKEMGSDVLDIRTVGSFMQDIEYVLFCLWAHDDVTPEEVEKAHHMARRIMENYLKPMGAFYEVTESMGRNEYEILK